ncbi:MAG: hypothetical protein GWP11_05860, partial [Proteobacteria bacterium]|nr:hypothetical protein [Pseudomonadota bacterium]
MSTIGFEQEELDFAGPLRLAAKLTLAANNETINEPRRLYDLALAQPNVTQLWRPVK